MKIKLIHYGSKKYLLMIGFKIGKFSYSVGIGKYGLHYTKVDLDKQKFVTVKDIFIKIY